MTLNDKIRSDTKKRYLQSPCKGWRIQKGNAASFVTWPFQLEVNTSKSWLKPCLQGGALLRQGSPGRREGNVAGNHS